MSVVFLVCLLLRESLEACRENLKSLHYQCTELEHRVAELEQQSGEGEGSGGREGGGGKTVASCGFLKTQLGRMRGEIEREEKVEKEFMEKLKVQKF